MLVGYWIEFLHNQPCALFCSFCRRAQPYVRIAKERPRHGNMLRLTQERRAMHRGDRTPKTITSAREISQPRLDGNLHETVLSNSIRTYGNTHIDGRYEGTSGAQPNMENEEESDSMLTGGQFREYLVQTLQKSGKKDFPDRSANVGFSHEGMRETLEEPSAYRIPMDCGHPAGHQSEPSKVRTMGQNQEPRTT